MKNLVMGVATGYDWYAIEPFIRSCKRHCENSDIVLFIDNTSDFTRNTLAGEGIILAQVPDALKNMLIINSRWIMYKIFLDRYGGNYGKIFLSDVRDVIFQGNLFEPFAEVENFLCCATEYDNIKNTKEHLTSDCLTRLFGSEVAERLADKKIICCGTVLGTLNAVKHLADKMIELLQRSTEWGDEQAAFNYLIYENQLEIENLIESNCEDGIILTSALFHAANPIQIQNNKILRGDGNTPAVVHQYDRYPVLVEHVNKMYRGTDFQPNENFNDTRSIFEQIICAVNSNNIDAAYKLFTRYLFGNDLTGYGNNLVKIFETVLSKDSSLAAEFLSLSIQSALPSIIKELNFQQLIKICSLTNSLMKSNRLILPQVKTLVKETLFAVAQRLYEEKQFEQGIEYLNFITALDVPLDANFYLLQARFYRETGRKAEALAAYSKALNF
ncbi:MAG: tetratricopeptide repeat protein [Selenomonadaceae bacterium]|nr:tetratricopeptide repeat protein [Selenomonadaceae bacterium]